jgi:glycosyltransferase-like protein
MRIALFTYAMQPRGGVLHAVALGEALQDLGHSVVLHALDDGSGGFIRQPRCPVRTFPMRSRRGDILAYVRAGVAAYVDAWDPATPRFDIYHAHDGISGNALATLVERRVIPHFLRTVHHLENYRSAAVEALQSRALRMATWCLVVSRLWREELRDQYGLDAMVVPNGVDATRFTPFSPVTREALRERLGYGAGPLFVTIGGIEARKNSLVALEAFALVQRRIPSARLIIAGGASILDHSAYRQAFDRRADELGLVANGALSIAGVLTDGEIVTLLQAANALVFPSLVEGFGLVVLEALACGTPVVTSAIAPFTEYLTPEDALLVDPLDPVAVADAMLRALESDVAANAAVRGPAVIAGMTWQSAAEAHARAYRAFGSIAEIAGA